MLDRNCFSKKRIKKSAILKKARCIIRNGFYFFEDDNLLLLNKKTISIKRLLRIHIVWGGSKIDNNRRLTIVPAYNKAFVALGEKCCYSFFRGKYDFSAAKERYCTYINLINYPVAKMTFFDDFLIAKSDIVHGEKHNSNRDDALIQRLLEFALDAEGAVINGFPCYVQHGDVVDKNIYWDGDRLFFIDLDDMGFKPILFDVLTLLGSKTYFLDDVMRILLKHKVLIQRVLNKYNLSFVDEDIDTIMLAFVSECHYKPNCFFLRNRSNMYYFPKTFKVVDDSTFIKKP